MTETEQKLTDALKLALYALNEIPNFGVRYEKYRNSYAVAVEIERVLRETAP